MTYRAPLAEQLFVLDAIGEIDHLRRLDRFADFDRDLIETILREGSRLASDRLDPLNRIGDVKGVEWSPAGVVHPSGFKDVYRQYVEGGWQGLAVGRDYGGQGLPLLLAVAVGEQLASANMAFSLCMVLTAGAVEALDAYATEDLKRLYLPKLISGEWTGTMNLTEPQAGSDVGALRTMATPTEDGSWLISGSKIFISWGEHELSENIIHLVLARTPDAPAGTRGLSLFVVPKFLPDDEGNPGPRNDLRCVSIERKLGIHASPTCTMSFGDNGHCVGWLIGSVNGGMKAMFAMMNHARLNIGLQGVAIAERAYQGALAYAMERVQSSPIGGGAPVVIVEHPDVRRMLMTMRALTQGIRAITILNAAAIDRALAGAGHDERSAASGLADLLTPITKSFATDTGVEVADIGIQVFGGMGFVEETGAAQHWRDSRIAPIYEGTNGIQALDLVRRKLTADQGQHWRRLFNEMQAFCASEPTGDTEECGRLREAIRLLQEATEHVISSKQDVAAAVASPYLRLFGTVLAAYLLARQSVLASARLSEEPENRRFLAAKIATASFFSSNILPDALALHRVVTNCEAANLLRFAEAESSPPFPGE